MSDYTHCRVCETSMNGRTKKVAICVNCYKTKTRQVAELKCEVDDLKSRLALHAGLNDMIDSYILNAR